jgi:hypothetical protein
MIGAHEEGCALGGGGIFKEERAGGVVAEVVEKVSLSGLDQVREEDESGVVDLGQGV